MVLASGVAADTSFTTGFSVENNDMAAIQVIWSGLDSSSSFLRLNARVRPAAVYCGLAASTHTMASGADHVLFNWAIAPFDDLQVEYDAGSATTGTLTIYACMKSRK
jgi:hypothetical protein